MQNSQRTNIRRIMHWASYWKRTKRNRLLKKDQDAPYLGGILNYVPLFCEDGGVAAPVTVLCDADLTVQTVLQFRHVGDDTYQPLSGG